MKGKYYFKMSLILIYIANLRFLSADLNITVVPEFRSLAICIREIATRELFWRPTVVFNTNNQTGKNNFINEVSKILSKEIRVLNTVSGTFNVNQGNYLFVDYFDDDVHLSNFDFDAVQKRIKYLLILENYPDNFRNSNFESIGDKVGKYDVSFLLKSPDLEYELLTFMPRIDENTCSETIEKSIINICKGDYLLEQITFPRKQPSDLKLCPFKVGLSALYPFSTIKNMESLKIYDSLENVEIEGMDLEIIKIISTYLNAKLELHYIHKSEGNPYADTEYLNLLMNGSLDACAGGLYRIFGDVVEYSGIYARQSIVWLYTADRLATSWENLVRNIDGLYLFMIFYVAYSVAWYIICNSDHRAVSLKSTLLYNWGALVGTASLPEPSSFKQKVLNLVYLIMCLHLSVYIGIQFYSFFTILAAPPTFSTNEDIMNSGRPPYLNPFSKYFVADEKYERFANTSYDCNSFLNCTIMSIQNKGLTVILEAYLINYQAATTVNDEAKLLRPSENLLVAYYEMLINKNSLLVLPFQTVIKRLFEAGIAEKLFVEAIGITKVHKTKTATQNILSNSYRCQEGCTISFEQASGVFYLWAIGCGIAFLFFILEILSEKEVGKKIMRRTNRTVAKIEKIL